MSADNVPFLMLEDPRGPAVAYRWRMCGRFTQIMSWSELVALYRIHDDTPQNTRARYNVSPTQDVPVLLWRHRPSRAAVSIQRFCWMASWCHESAVPKTLPGLAEVRHFEHKNARPTMILANLVS